MITAPELQQFIDDHRAKGIPDGDIRRALETAGWEGVTLDQAFAPTTHPVPNTPPLTGPQPHALEWSLPPIEQSGGLGLPLKPIIKEGLTLRGKIIVFTGLAFGSVATTAIVAVIYFYGIYTAADRVGRDALQSVLTLDSATITINQDASAALTSTNIQKAFGNDANRVAAIEYGFRTHQLLELTDRLGTHKQVINGQEIRVTSFAVTLNTENTAEFIREYKQELADADIIPAHANQDVADAVAAGSSRISGKIVVGTFDNRLYEFTINDTTIILSEHDQSTAKAIAPADIHQAAVKMIQQLVGGKDQFITLTASNVLQIVEDPQQNTTQPSNEVPDIAIIDVDSDNDNLTDNEEFIYLSNPLNPDTDADGFLDGEEVKNGFSPVGKGKL